MRSESIKEISAALSKFQGEIKPVKKESKNPFYKSMYADLASINSEISEPLSKNGLSITQFPETEPMLDGKPCKVILTTLLMHISGEWLSNTISSVSKDSGSQSIGSCITYLRRYGIQAILNLSSEDSSEDDDGEGGKTDFTSKIPDNNKTNKKLNQKSEKKTVPEIINSSVIDEKLEKATNGAGQTAIFQSNETPKIVNNEIVKKFPYNFNARIWNLSGEQKENNLNSLNDLLQIIQISTDKYEILEAGAAKYLPSDYQDFLKLFIKGTMQTWIDEGELNEEFLKDKISVTGKELLMKCNFTEVLDILGQVIYAMEEKKENINEFIPEDLEPTPSDFWGGTK